MKKRISINMLSSADKVGGQGVGSAYLEQVKLVKEGANDLFDIHINDRKVSDIVHHHTIEPTHLLKLRSKKSVNVCYVHFLPSTLEGSIKLPKPLFYILKKYVICYYRKADRLIVVNPLFMKDLTTYGLDSNKMVYIPNYVSKEDFYEYDEQKRTQIREKYGVAKDAFVVIGVGQVQTRKGVLDFIEVAKRMPDITFVWSGGFSFGKITDGYEELKQIVEHPPTNVKFLGIIPRTDMNEIYNLCDTLFMPSYNELFPMAILEAVNLHRPLVLRDLELYRDILFERYEKGNNNEEFVNRIRALKDDAMNYQKASEDAKYISQYYSKENVLEIWKKFYQDVYNEKNK